MAMEKALFNHMLSIKDILTAERTLYFASVKSKKKALEVVSDSLAGSIPTLVARDIFDKLIERERLGSTTIGHGVAIPHARLDGLEKPIGSFLILKEAVDFDTEDHPQVNMIFALLVPIDANEEHLELLATIARIFSREAFRQDLEQTISKVALYNRLIRE